MSDCKICFHKNNGKFMRRPVEGNCPVCDPEIPIEPAKDACVCPPLGEPKLLTCVAPVVFDECGINLCREIKIPECLLEENPCTKAIELKVIDIDFSIGEIDGSCVETLPKRPNCVRVTLSKLKVRFAAKLLDRHCKVLAEECFQALYLPGKDSPHCDDDTNPPSISIDLYTPYGVSYYGECKECIPCINYLGFVEGPNRNNELRQGIGCQALAKVIEFDQDDGCMAVGLTLYLKAIYFIQYRIKHAGLCVPPKCIPINPCEQNPCLEFVEGNLLEQSIQPLELCTRPKTFNQCSYDPVEDPTPTDEAATKKECDPCL